MVAVIPDESGMKVNSARVEWMSDAVNEAREEALGFVQV